jgi:hypothetical protein
VGNKVDMKKFNELQKKIKEWEKDTQRQLTGYELELKQIETGISLVTNKFSSVLKGDKATYIGNWVEEGKGSVETLKRFIKKARLQLNCQHESINEDEYEGHDSHYDYYQTRCNVCDAVFDSYKH